MNIIEAILFVLGIAVVGMLCIIGIFYVFIQNAIFCDRTSKELNEWYNKKKENKIVTDKLSEYSIDNGLTISEEDVDVYDLEVIFVKINKLKK